MVTLIAFISFFKMNYPSVIQINFLQVSIFLDFFNNEINIFNRH